MEHHCEPPKTVQKLELIVKKTLYISLSMGQSETVGLAPYALFNTASIDLFLKLQPAKGVGVPQNLLFFYRFIQTQL